MLKPAEQYLIDRKSEISKNDYPAYSPIPMMGLDPSLTPIREASPISSKKNNRSNEGVYEYNFKNHKDDLMLKYSFKFKEMIQL